MRVLDVEVREVNDLQPIAHRRIVFHHAAGGIDQLDDALGMR